ncbi:MAG: SET domain-containing protein-lysine N-methyltransferase [Chitinophagaceae bacterium]|nr:SET domain-containing protein-lysine N-methyltransferase [Chitinophagaceae bacterium]MBL0055280.1 SET domain-containing protein-lysine N-methyltransferase [Chitinophagaceae bacterium]
MSINTLQSEEKLVVSRHQVAHVLRHTGTGQQSLHAAIPFSTGEVICAFHAGITQNFATYLTVQTGVDRHITLVPEFLQYINHSCEPTVFFNTDTFQLICLKALEPGDELTFFYPSTEWEMAQPFLCSCKSPSCLQLINGASHLEPETLARYRLSGFIERQIKLKQNR